VLLFHNMEGKLCVYIYIYIYIWVVLNGGYSCFDAGINGVRLNMGLLARALKRVRNNNSG
jgi:hypothetical protein